MTADIAARTSRGTLLTPQLFDALSRFITAELGIKMPPSKRTMLQSRLQKRLRRLRLDSFEAYHDYVFSDEGRDRELHHLLDAVTTNKTDFFREPRHFQVLTETTLPDLLNQTGAGLRRPLKLWSAGCSTGAEAYTLTMVLSEYAGQVQGFAYQILATDISTRVLETGRQAIYEEREVEPVPMALKKKYLLRSKDRGRPRVRIIPDLRGRVKFQRLNLMDADYGRTAEMDIIFCRNVIIYFDRPTQEAVLARLCRCLKPGGYLFMGHSETLNGFNLPLRQIATTVYRKL
ncbi:CheR family methyltransferase [Desulfatitalea tepidiphila]|uniref:CheR family methyltransferase n=1 Tax=Desulfatitalea tepidiphila TaxID=1185843 RepID=UPI0006B60488|nr:CheR family methyltransferase [Desulfatitalea tepidiphila]